MSASSGLLRLTEPLIRLRWRLTRGMTLGARVAAVDAEGRVALIRHVYKAGWHFPGGGIERGERAEEAAVRELREEANAALEGPLELWGVFANFEELRGDHLMFYRARARSLGPRKPDLEIAEVGWFRPDSPPEGATPGTLRRLAELFDGAPRDLDW
jgi:ADP-ribose pyrophosphatase YjhB (NUDIX family)